MESINYTLTDGPLPCECVEEAMHKLDAAAKALRLDAADVDTPEGLAAFAYAESACLYDDGDFVRCAISLRRAVALVNELLETSQISGQVLATPCR